MRQTISIPIEHMVVASDWSDEQVKESLEARLSVTRNIDELIQRLAAVKASWQQVTQTIAKQLGTSGFSLFSTVDHGTLFFLAGTPTTAAQSAIGNPLLAIQRSELAPEVAFSAPLRRVVDEKRAGKAFVASERFTSQLAQDPNPQIAPLALLVEQKLAALVAEATGDVKGKEP